VRVLILGARAPACLEWARAFAESGWEVTVADSLRWPVSRFSRAAHHFIRLPEPKSHPAAWRDALARAVVALGIDWIIPTCEEVFYLSWHLAALRKHCQIFTSDFALLHRLHHKGRFAEMITGWPTTAPETHLISQRSDLSRFAAHSEGWVFKPAYSRFGAKTLIRPIARRVQEIVPTVEFPWVAQRFVAGREHCSFSILDQGTVIAHSCYHPRYRVGRGSGIYFQPTNPAAIGRFVQQFGAATGYTGQVGFDFMEDEDGRIHVLECNPRATSGVHLFDDQHERLVELFAEEAPKARPDRPPVLKPSPEPRMVGLAMLVFAIWRHGLEPRFWRDFWAGRDVLWRPGDLGPLPAQVAGLLEIFARAMARRRGLLPAATADIEWDGQPIDPPEGASGA
jgi:hypothetical protein